MKKLFFILALALPMLASAQQFAHINTQELFVQMPELNDVKAKMDTLQSQYENQLAMMQEELNKKVQEFQQGQATMTDGVREFRQQELADLEQRVQVFYQTAQQDIQRKQQEYLAPVQEKMLTAIQEVGKEKGYTYVFDTAAMLYISETANDIMGDVKLKLGIK
ncbi:MAG: OmpH family outer membrane protein [Paludibacteraceae bacterium]|nr:OmpH family outer membrane protein [Paludibacteraceae bacterium]